MSNPEYQIGVFDERQVWQLLQAINTDRVLTANGHSHVSQQDITAHLIRVFGFGGHSTEILDLECVSERVRPFSQRQEEVEISMGNNKPRRKSTYALEPQLWRYDVVYRCTMRLTVFTKDHLPVGPFDNASTGESQNNALWDAHDLAMKSAISLALKRCTINLGDQFGLSLYNKGQTRALVMDTLVIPQALADLRAKQAGGEQPDQSDVSTGVEKQVALGVDETAYDPQEPTPEKDAALDHSLGQQKP